MNKKQWLAVYAYLQGKLQGFGCPDSKVNFVASEMANSIDDILKEIREK